MKNSENGSPLAALLAMALMGAIEDMKEMIKKELPLDETPKKVGDVVKLVHSSMSGYILDTKEEKVFNIGEFDDEMRDDMRLFGEQEFVVMANNLDIKFNCGHCEEEHTAHLELRSRKDGEKYFIDNKLVTTV